ncbi:MAG: DUF169 domain-containing protein [Chloroflexi bacterium]|nr:DUF169 domain-containing protein [Chloroflexota bacterium]
MKEDLRSYGAELESKLRLSSMPLAIKLLQNESDVPAWAARPLRDLGHRLALCQALALSRREGLALAILKEDNWCPYPVIGLGLAEAPSFFLEGRSVMPGSRTTQGARNWAQSYPRLEAGKYAGAVCAPLKTALFEPDVVMMYVNSAQLGRTLSALSYESGRDLVSRICSDAACSYYIVPVVLGAEAVLSVPCGGDRRRAIARDDEVVISLAPGKIGGLVQAMRKLDEAGLTFPRPPDMVPECQQPPAYNELLGMLGITGSG